MLAAGLSWRAKCCFKQRWLLSGEKDWWCWVCSYRCVLSLFRRERERTHKDLRGNLAYGQHRMLKNAPNIQPLIYIEPRLEMSLAALCKDCHFGLMFDDCCCRMWAMCGRFVWAHSAQLRWCQYGMRPLLPHAQTHARSLTLACL